MTWVFWLIGGLVLGCVLSPLLDAWTTYQWEHNPKFRVKMMNKLAKEYQEFKEKESHFHD